MDYTIEAVIRVWSISIVIVLVVIGVVALLLHIIRNTARDIENGASAIWTQGKLVANNTIHIPTLLNTTNSVADQIHQNAGDILENAVEIVSHIDGCPGCPDCVLDHSTK